jgi:hypothetical protein
VPSKGWFPISRFYGPQAAFFDKTWKLSDVEPEHHPGPVVALGGEPRHGAPLTGRIKRRLR